MLEQLHRDDVDLVCWQRPLPEALATQLRPWAARVPERFHEVVSPAQFDSSTMLAELAEPARTWLAADLADLLALFADLTGSSHLRISFGPVRTNQCTKFHVDHVRFRMVTTFIGPGTQWVPAHAVRKDALDHPLHCPCDANAQIVRDAAAIRHSSAGEVIVMKGALHPQHLGTVHRSPEIEGTGQVRVVLIASTIDAS